MNSKRWPRTFAAWLIVLAMLLGALPVAAQIGVGPRPLPNPNIQLTGGGSILAIAAQPDGGLVIGGAFNMVNGVARANLARLRADGTLDPDWNPSPDDVVWALAVGSDGSVYVGGRFDTIGGHSRSKLAKLAGSGNGAADANWNPSVIAYSGVATLAVDASGAVYVGGAFSHVGGVERQNIARVSGSGSGAVDANWNPGANSSVDALAFGHDGAVYAGGGFTKIGGQWRNYIAKLAGSGTGAVDPSWNPNANAAVRLLAVDSSGAVFAGGPFAVIGGQTRIRIAKLAGSGSGAADASWKPNVNGVVLALVVDSSDAVYVGGTFTAVYGEIRAGLAKLTGSGSGALDRWNPAPDDDVRVLALGGSDTIHVAGDFSTIGGEPRSRLAALPGTAVWRTLTYTAATGGTIFGVSPQVVTDGGNGVPVWGAPNDNYRFAQWSDGSTDNPRTDTHVGADRSFTASFVHDPHYTVTATAGANGTITPASQSVRQGERTLLTVTPAANYRATVSGCGGSLNGAYYHTGVITGNCTVTASFTTDTYTVTATAGANGSITPASRTVDRGATTTFTVTPAAGLLASVNGCGGSLSGNTYTTGPITAHCAVTASFASTLYTVSATAGANGSITPASQTVLPGATTTLTVTPAAGYLAIVSGCGGSLSGATYTTGPISAHCAVTASFQLAGRHTVTAIAGPHGMVNPTSVDVLHNAITSIQVMPHTGYRIGSATGCNGQLSPGGGYTTGPITADCEITTSFVEDTYTVTATAGANGMITPASKVVDAGTTTTLVVLPGAGYRVASVSGCNGSLSGNLYTTGAITSNCAITASFMPGNPDAYSVVATAGANGTISPGSQTVSPGATTTFTVTPAAHYQASVIGCGGSLSGDTYTTAAINGYCTVEATFTPETHRVTAVAGTPGGSTNPTSVDVMHGAITVIQLLPSPGFHVSDATGCGGELQPTGLWYSNYRTGSITADCQITASFAPDTFTVTAMAGANGTITPASQTANHGARATFTVTHDAGYHADVSGCDGSLSGNLYTTGVITGNCAVTASFAPGAQTHTVTATSSGGSISLSPPSQTVEQGSTTTFTVVALAGHQPIVTGCDGSLSGNTYTTGAITANCAVTATAQYIGSHTVTAVAGPHGTVTPTSVAVLHRWYTRITVKPDEHFHISSVTGCDGMLTPVYWYGHYDTGQITADCHVTASFASDMHTVTATAGANGTITPASQTVDYGAPVTLTVTPTDGYRANVSGCGGSLDGNTYTIDSVRFDCAVDATFVDPTYIFLTLDAGRDYVRYGQALTYVVSLGNFGSLTLNAASIAMALPAQVDAGAATWTCTNIDPEAHCSASGSGALHDSGVVIPAGRSLTWLVTVPVRMNAAGGTVETSVSASAVTANVSRNSQVTLVTMRDGFELNGDGAQGVVDFASCPSDSESTTIDEAWAHHFTLPSAIAGMIDTVLVARGHNGAGFRVERANLGDTTQVQLIAIAADGRESASAWAAVRDGATLTLAVASAADGQRTLILDGAATVLSTPLSVEVSGALRIETSAARDDGCN